MIDNLTSCEALLHISLKSYENRRKELKKILDLSYHPRLNASDEMDAQLETTLMEKMIQLTLRIKQVETMIEQLNAQETILDFDEKLMRL